MLGSKPVGNDAVKSLHPTLQNLLAVQKESDLHLEAQNQGTKRTISGSGRLLPGSAGGNNSTHSVQLVEAHDGLFVITTSFVRNS